MNYDINSAVTRAEALEQLCLRWPAGRECVLLPLEQSFGCVTAQDIYASNTLPVCRVSALDGFAVRSADFADGIPDTSDWVLGEQYASADTGDDFPDAYDTVIAVEDVSFDARGALRLNPDFAFVKGGAVRAAGSMARSGELIVPAHTRITPTLLAALAVGGARLVPVLRPLKVAYIPTGSELVPTGVTPRRGENVEANGLMLSAFLLQWGAETVRFPIVRDHKAQLDEVLEQAISCADLVVINGGSSRGGEDFNAALLEQKGSFFSHGVKAVPGRPVGTALIHGKPVVNLPGPVPAAWLASDWLLKGLVYHYYGLPVPRRERVRAVLNAEIRKGPAFEMLSRVALKRTAAGFEATPLPRSASLPQSLRDAAGLLTIPIGCTGYSAGETVEVELLADI